MRSVPLGNINKFVRYCSTFNPFAFAVEIIEYRTALAFAPDTVLQNSQFFLPTATGRIAFSHGYCQSEHPDCLRNSVDILFRLIHNSQPLLIFLCL